MKVITTIRIETEMQNTEHAKERDVDVTLDLFGEDLQEAVLNVIRDTDLSGYRQIADGKPKVSIAYDWESRVLAER